MKILVINGSPRGERSNTLRLTKAFLAGFPEDTQTEYITLRALDIRPCAGCYSCWTKTPGKCVIKDDMQALYQKIEDADVIVESFPLFFFGMPSTLKAMTDRCLSMMMPYLGWLSKDGCASFHELRKPAMLRKKLVIVTTCGYVVTEPMYPALLKQLDLICGEGKYTAIMASEGELFGYDMAQRQQNAYFADLTAAGREYSGTFALCEETRAKISKPVLSPQAFEKISSAHWNSFEGNTPPKD